MVRCHIYCTSKLDLLKPWCLPMRASSNCRLTLDASNANQFGHFVRVDRSPNITLPSINIQLGRKSHGGGVPDKIINFMIEDTPQIWSHGIPWLSHHLFFPPPDWSLFLRPWFLGRATTTILLTFDRFRVLKPPLALVLLVGDQTFSAGTGSIPVCVPIY